MSERHGVGREPLKKGIYIQITHTVRMVGSELTRAVALDTTTRAHSLLLAVLLLQLLHSLRRDLAALVVQIAYAAMFVHCTLLPKGAFNVIVRIVLIDEFCLFVSNSTAVLAAHFGIAVLVRPM